MPDRVSGFGLTLAVMRNVPDHADKGSADIRDKK
jgi:hypothetical protein